MALHLKLYIYISQIEPLLEHPYSSINFNFEICYIIGRNGEVSKNKIRI